MDLIVKNLYGCFKNSILTDKSVTNFIHQQKGNCFKPLTFSLVIDTFTLSIKQEQYNRFGYKIVKYLTPRQRYQFADFVVYIARLKSENKILLNVFSRCCAWAKGDYFRRNMSLFWTKDFKFLKCWVNFSGFSFFMPLWLSFYKQKS